MSNLRLGIVGAGMIAGVVAKATQPVDSITLAAVASRRQETAQSFADEHGIPKVFTTWQEMIASDEIDAVYIATPTNVKEEIALFAADNKKHLLVDKPFASSASVQRMVDAARANGVAFMDATHFSNHPRTQQIREDMEVSIGAPQALRSSFFFPFQDRENIRFNPEKEPTGAVGDMAWYSMRAIVEYLQPAGAIRTLSGSVMRDKETGAVVRGTGVVVFDDDKSSTFDFGYSAGVCLMDLDILGHEGMFHISDFVLDWKDGFTFDAPDHVTGYTKRAGMAEPKDFEFVATEAKESQAVNMMRNFAALVKQPKSAQAENAVAFSLKTQQLVDAYWDAVK